MFGRSVEEKKKAPRCLGGGGLRCVEEASGFRMQKEVVMKRLEGSDCGGREVVSIIHFPFITSSRAFSVFYSPGQVQ
jgi:hypothetical protein